MNETNQDSQLFGVSVRSILAMFTVGSGLLFLYAATFMLFRDDKDLTMVVVTAVIGFINLALGYYLGQKQAQQNIEAEIERRVAARLAEIGQGGA